MVEFLYHPIADVFPLMFGQAFDDLTEDIRTNGLREPIWLYDDKVLDGRNRLRACNAAGVMPVFCEYKGQDPLGFVVSLNLHRRHLTESQRAMVGSRIATMKHGGDRKSNQVVNWPLDLSVSKASELMNVSEKSVHRANKVQTHGIPELIRKVDAGEVKVSVASDVATLPEDEQRHLVALNEKAILNAAKNIRAKDRHKKQQQLEQDRQRQADQIRIKPLAPVVYYQEACDFLRDQSKYDLLLTDPPYSTEIENIAGFAQSWLPLALSKMKTTGRAYVFIGAYPEELKAYLQVAMPDQVLVWTYRNTLGPCPSGRYKQNWQAILYYRGSSAADLDCPELNERFSVQDINAPDGRQGDRFHAWQKPDALADRLVRHASREQDRVIDPFCCTGTFLLAAARYGRRAEGCDNSLEHLNIALSRGCQRGLHRRSA